MRSRALQIIAFLSSWIKGASRRTFDEEAQTEHREMRRNRPNFRQRRWNVRIRINHDKRPPTARLIGTLIAFDEPPIPRRGTPGIARQRRGDLSNIGN